MFTPLLSHIICNIHVNSIKQSIDINVTKHLISIGHKNRRKCELLDLLYIYLER